MRKSSLSSSKVAVGTMGKKAKAEGPMTMKKGPWTAEEDQLLTNCIKRDGEGRWRTLPKRAGLQRCGKSCRLRWMNYLRPSVKRGLISPDEEDLILRLHRLLGNRWSLIAGRIPGRTDNDIKNYWNTHLSKKLLRQGIDPRTHKALVFHPPTSRSSAACQDESNSSSIHDDSTTDAHPSPDPHQYRRYPFLISSAMSPPQSNNIAAAPLPLLNEEEDANTNTAFILSTAADLSIIHDHDTTHHLPPAAAVTTSDSAHAILMTPNYTTSLLHHPPISGDPMPLDYDDHDHDVFSSFLNSLLNDDIDIFPSSP